MLRFAVILSALFSYMLLKGQDPQFSQAYAVPLYLGPSFAGTTGGTRVTTNYRDQWPALKGAYVSYSLSADHFFSSTNSGFGLAILRDQAGMGLVTSTNCLLQYAYVFNINKTLQVRPGIEASYMNRTIDYSKIVFGDQLTFEGNLPSTAAPLVAGKLNYLDFAGSILLLHPDYWIGISLHHLPGINQSSLGAGAKNPVKFTMYAGEKILLNAGSSKRRGEVLSVAMVFDRQAKYNQCYAGVNLEFNRITTGLWYRGIPFNTTYQSYFNNDAVVFLVGYKFERIKVGYSYDFTTSHLLGNTGGAHEVTLIYTLKPIVIQPKQPKRKMVPCNKDDDPFEG